MILSAFHVSATDEPVVLGPYLYISTGVDVSQKDALSSHRPPAKFTTIFLLFALTYQVAHTPKFGGASVSFVPFASSKVSNLWTVLSTKPHGKRCDLCAAAHLQGHRKDGTITHRNQESTALTSNEHSEAIIKSAV